MTKNYIEFRVYIKDRDIDNISEIAETLKDMLYDTDLNDEIVPVEDVTYEIKLDSN